MAGNRQDAGVGYILRYRVVYLGLGVSKPFLPLNTPTCDVWVRNENATVKLPDEIPDQFQIKYDIQIRFIKIPSRNGDSYVARLTENGTITVAYSRLFIGVDPTFRNRPSLEREYQMTQRIRPRGFNLKLDANTCVTPDVNVDLGKWSINEFKGVGTVVGKKILILN